MQIWSCYWLERCWSAVIQQQPWYVSIAEVCRVAFPSSKSVPSCSWFLFSLSGSFFLFFSWSLFLSTQPPLLYLRFLQTQLAFSSTMLPWKRTIDMWACCPCQSSMSNPRYCLTSGKLSQVCSHVVVVLLCLSMHIRFRIWVLPFNI